MAAENFKPGDVVQLKSGGPRMTVTETGRDIAQREMVYCVWFEGKIKKEDAFPPATLGLA